MAIRKIELMHKLFGKTEGKTCKECLSLTGGKNEYKKCRVYGFSSAESTDWAMSWPACGMFNRAYKGKPAVKMVTPERVPPDQPLEGQITFEEL